MELILRTGKFGNASQEIVPCPCIVICSHLHLLDFNLLRFTSSFLLLDSDHLPPHPPRSPSNQDRINLPFHLYTLFTIANLNHQRAPFCQWRTCSWRWQVEKCFYVDRVISGASHQLWLLFFFGFTLVMYMYNCTCSSLILLSKIWFRIALRMTTQLLGLVLCDRQERSPRTDTIMPFSEFRTT